MESSADEKVIFATRFSKKIFAKPLLAAFVFLVAAIVFTKIGWEYSNYGFWCSLLLAVLALLPPFSKYFLSQYVLTNKRIMIRHGFIARQSYEMLLNKVESIQVDQTLSDRIIWGSGTLIITGTGGTKESFPNVGGAIKFQKHLDEAIHAS
jgi:uncharacterized membrane protein YdbT with pleckstrin-like domain